MPKREVDVVVTQGTEPNDDGQTFIDDNLDELIESGKITAPTGEEDVEFLVNHRRWPHCGSRVVLYRGTSEDKVNNMIRFGSAGGVKAKWSVQRPTEQQCHEQVVLGRRLPEFTN